MMRWIGREVTKFLEGADIHLPFLLRVAAAPAELLDDIAAELETGEDGGIALDEDDPEFALFRPEDELGLGDGSSASSSSPCSVPPTFCTAPSPPPWELGEHPPPPVLFGEVPASHCWPSPSPQPFASSSSSFEAASFRAAELSSFRGMHNQSPGLMLAIARSASRNGDPASSCASSCATPSRAPLPLRPPTPGAPGSNVRRTTSILDGLDDGSLSPGAEDSPEPSSSLTDTALMEVTQSLTSFSIGAPIGSKRTAEVRDR